MTLASETNRQRIREACRSNRWSISGRTTRWLGTVGVSHDVVIQALIRHVDEGCLIHIKVLHSSVSYHGTLLLSPDDSETVYFEVKLQDSRSLPGQIWLQVHSHDTGYPILARN